MLETVLVPVTVTETAMPVAVVAESNVDDIGHAAAAKRRLSVSPNHRGLLSNVLRVPLSRHVPAVPSRPGRPSAVRRSLAGDMLAEDRTLGRSDWWAIGFNELMSACGGRQPR